MAVVLHGYPITLCFDPYFLSRLNERIDNLNEQIELRDQHYKQQLKTKDLQTQLVTTRLRQQTEIFEQDELRVCVCIFTYLNQ